MTLKECNQLYLSLEEDSGGGMVKGEAGLALVNAYFYKVYGDSYYAEICEQELKKCIHGKLRDCSWGYGLAGTAWMVNRLGGMGILDGASDWLERTDQILAGAARGLLEDGVTNYFFGALGVLNYLLDREGHTEVEELCETLVRLLEENFETLPFLHFDPHLRQDGKLLLNLGVPHGVLGIIAILLKIQEKKIRDTCEITGRFIQLLMSYRMDGRNYVFPTYEIGESRSSLAWCYGDLPACYFLHRFGKLSGDTRYEEFNRDLLEKCLVREDHFENNVAICHGTTVVAYLFYKLSKCYPETACAARSAYWLNLSECYFEQEGAAYRKEGKCACFLRNPSFISGFPGYFIALMTMKGQIEDRWDSGLLLQ